MMSKCQLFQKKYAEAQPYAEAAKAVYPQEAKAYHLTGVVEKWYVGPYQAPVP